MGKGYHPPPTDGFTDVLRWFLVAVPDKEEYVRAATGAYTDLAKQWKWDGTVGSTQDAEDSFDEAIAATLEALEMGFPDILLGYIDEVEALLESLQYIGGCCNANDPSDGTLYTDNVSDGVGTVPQNIVDAGFATDTSDWAGFDDYKCMIAHVIVDSMEAKLRKFAPLIDASGTVIGGIAALIGIVTTIWTSGLTALAGAILASTSATATLWKNLSDQASTLSLADDVATNHDALACAFYDGTDGPAAAIAALKAEIDNLFGPIDAIILKNLNMEPEARALYAGRYDQQNIAQKLADAGYDPAGFDCSCIAPSASQSYTFDADVEGWTREDTATAPLWENPPSPAPPSGTATIRFEQFDTYMRSPDFPLIGFNRVSWDAVFYNFHSTGTVVGIELRRSSDDALIQSSQLNGPAGSWVTKNYDDLVVTAQTEQNFHIRVASGNRGGRLDSCTVTVSTA